MEEGGAMEAAAAELERLQIDILRRISVLDNSFLPQSSSPSSLSLPIDENETVARLSAILRSGDVNDFCFKRVAPDYYNWSFESRRDVLGASSVNHLCKSIVLVNTQASSNILDCSDRNNSKYYVVVVQYTARFNAEAVKQFLYSLNEGKIPKKRFNLRLAPEETSIKLTGFEHNAVTCIGMKTDIPQYIQSFPVHTHVLAKRVTDITVYCPVLIVTEDRRFQCPMVYSLACFSKPVQEVWYILTQFAFATDPKLEFSCEPAADCPTHSLSLVFSPLIVEN